MARKETSNLVVLMFEGQDTAETLYKQIEQMEHDKLVVIDDAVIIEREYSPDTTEAADSTLERSLTPSLKKSVEDSIRVKQTRGKKGKYAAVGGGIGLLAAAIFGGPIGLVAVATAGLGAVTAALKDFGVDDNTIASLKQRMQPNTSALLLLGRANDKEAFQAKLREYDVRVVMTSLDPEVERDLVARLQG